LSAASVRAASNPAALLVLEDGSSLRGTGFGAEGEAFGEIVFNTAMVGYQEVLTDPSYARQVVVMTSPHQGNYGTNPDDAESSDVQVAGFVVREASRRASSWRARRTLADELAAAGVVGVEGVDTRALALRIRGRGAMRCGISTRDLDPGSLLARVRSAEGMRGADLASSVSSGEPYGARTVVGDAIAFDGRTYRVAAYDLGIKTNILRLLAAEGCEVTVVPARTPASEVVRGHFDGVFLSNGPGDPDATAYGIRASRDLLGAVPVFGICLGHQLMAHALGGKTVKMKFGHRGANHPVKNLETGVVEITSHNHGFVVDPRAWGVPDGLPVPDAAPIVGTPQGRVALTHWNLNDGTLEGFHCLDVPAFAVQYHPEAAPGPHDSRYLFDEFRALMGAAV
jgi:carbamoyl-phosphate synthase small subunit